VLIKVISTKGYDFLISIVGPQNKACYAEAIKEHY